MAPDKLRPGSSAAIALWKTSEHNKQKWYDALKSYPKCVKLVKKELKNSQTKLSKSNFIDDDNWKENELTNLVQNQKNINLEQLERLMIWKLRRGVFRAPLMGLIRKNTEITVQNTTQSAFGYISSSPITVSNIKKAFSILNTLHGVGPATASLILSVYVPKYVPFMSDEAMDAALGLPRLYTDAQFARFQDALSEKAKELGTDWSPDQVEKALWCAATLSKYENE